jgi:dihydrofolate synthase/folylpolyglutamate synthase
VPYILQLCEKNDIPATFFELTTALAFHQFGRHSDSHTHTQGHIHGHAPGKIVAPTPACDVVVMEVGLGGRLDATNILTNTQTVLSVLTSVQLDHTKILGNTVEAIAREKAGIMKPGIDVLVGPHAPLHVLQVLPYFIVLECVLVCRRCSAYVGSVCIRRNVPRK